MATEDRTLKGFSTVDQILDATPEGAALIALFRRSGFWLSNKEDVAARKKFITNISKLSSEALGDEAAYWQSELSRILERLGVLESEKLNLTAQVKRERHRVTARILQEYRDKKEKAPAASQITAEVEIDDNVCDLEDKLLRVDRVIVGMQALRESFEGYRQTISREITRRSGGFSGRAF